MNTNKYVSTKFFLWVFFLIIKFTSFSQITHKDSLGYLSLLRVNSTFGNNFKGRTMPVFIAKNNRGELFTNENLRSKITFINFWFESCAPCVAEFQALEKFYNRNKSRENFQFISITFEQDSTIEKVRNKYNLTYPIYYLSHDSCKIVKFNAGYPTNLIVDKNQKIIYSIAGGSTDPEVADKDLNYFIQAELDKQLNR